MPESQTCARCGHTTPTCTRCGRNHPLLGGQHAGRVYCHTFSEDRPTCFEVESGLPHGAVLQMEQLSEGTRFRPRALNKIVGKKVPLRRNGVQIGEAVISGVEVQVDPGAQGTVHYEINVRVDASHAPPMLNVTGISFTTGTQEEDPADCPQRPAPLIDQPQRREVMDQETYRKRLDEKLTLLKEHPPGESLDWWVPQSDAHAEQGSEYLPDRLLSVDRSGLKPIIQTTTPTDWSPTAPEGNTVGPVEQWEPTDEQ